MIRSRRFSIVVLLFAVAASACADNTTATTTTPKPVTPTTPTTPPAPVTSPTTSTLTTQLFVDDAVSRTFTTSKAGTVSVTLSRAGADGTMVGLGIGIPQGELASCTLSTSMNTAASATPQLNVAVDNGSYCVTVYDVGTLTDTISFDLTIVYP